MLYNPRQSLVTAMSTTNQAMRITPNAKVAEITLLTLSVELGLTLSEIKEVFSCKQCETEVVALRAEVLEYLE